MFKRLQLQLTALCSAVTGALLLILTLICLFIAEKNQQESRYNSFLSEASSILAHLEQQDVVSLPWINQLREKNGCEFVIYDNGRPLFSQCLTSPEKQLGGELIASAIETARNGYALDLFFDNGSTLPRHAEFLLSAGGAGCYVSAAVIPKTNGILSVLIFYDLTAARRAVTAQRLSFAAADFGVLLLLVAFFYLFTGRMLHPLAENNRRQTHFVASASHELRTPLAVILSGAEALEKCESAEKKRHFGLLIRQEGRRMQRLLSDMLLLAGSDANSLSLCPARCQPDELLLAAYEKYELLAADKQISLSMRLPENDFADIYCDGDRILQLLSILLDNALSYTPSGGSVTLALEADPNAALTIFRVIDTGCGISAEEKPHIFDRFYRAEHSRTDKEHFGLGLCIAKELAEAHRGKIFVTDNPGGGACFSVALKNNTAAKPKF